jgi:rare lipoprotein A
MRIEKINWKCCLVCCLIALLCSCARDGREFQYKNLSEEVEAIKEDGGYYKVGNPYKVLGQYYTPKEDYNYSEVGIASWYGDDFHNKRTANGETYDMRAITAAHRTLPLPSIVKVTNLENGRSIIARVNDRGPYVKNRIIDVSQKGAELLGYRNKGTAKVRVEILAKESKAIKEAMLSKDNKSGISNEAIRYDLALNDAKAGAPVLEENNNVKTVEPVEKGHFFVQVGAFSDYNKAKEMANSMKRFGNVSIFEAYLSKDGVYRVRLGAYQSRSEAEQILDRVLDYGHADVSIVQG